MAANYVRAGFSRHYIKNGRFTLKYLQRTSSQNSAHIPWWEMFMRNHVLQMTMKLLKIGSQSPFAEMTILIDSGLSNGLAFKLDVTGIEVSEADEIKYILRMEQYLEKMSKVINVKVQTPWYETCCGQRRRQVSEIQNETPLLFCCKLEAFSGDVFGGVAIVPNDTPLTQVNNIIGSQKLSDSIPSAFLREKRIPLSCVSPIISVFIPLCSFEPYLVNRYRLTTSKVYLMIATPVMPGCTTGLLPFLFQDDAEYDLMCFESLDRWEPPRIRINSPLVKERAPSPPPGFRGAERSYASSTSND